MPDYKLLTYYDDNPSADVRRFMKGEVVSIHDINEDLGTKIDPVSGATDNLLCLVTVTDTTMAAWEPMLEEMGHVDAYGNWVVDRRRLRYIDHAMLPEQPARFEGGGTPVFEGGTEAELAAAVKEHP